ncbi:nitronate monooxygenase [uncultured Azohydromonas sp.]|uniref:NAD(P)H-dependent flavin oxidoreductase n=1 Tax=uncultured Azohydromonas sp. TaxID=487342 RepID=UPI0026173F86|nr:nitronate monooxygenase [uncultured Azohydromonas sp.]
MSRTSKLLSLLRIRHPIIQAPMVGVSTPQLAAAVSNAGALGSIGLGASTAAQSRAMIEATRALTDKPFNVNLFCHQPAVADAEREAAWIRHLAPLFTELGATPPSALSLGYETFLASEETLEVLLQERPAVASFHFGLPPSQWIRALRDAGVVTLACATSPAEAALAVEAGVDAVIAQGVEAGGHRGVFDPSADEHLGTLALVELVVATCPLPVIAAGGIMNGRTIAAAMQMGAAAVQMGTAFILCPESSANAQYRSALQGERAHHTRVSAAISGRPARGMVNRLFTDIGGNTAPALPDYPIAYDAAKSLQAAAISKGNHDFAVQWAGQGAPLARTLPAAELVGTLVRELNAATRGGH